ncbi:MAG: hypothetical protein IT336_06540 [Thermomicrobiales bacterium]|nr:hypothetical protein [Thermomicrobiales bacterium]
MALAMPGCVCERSEARGDAASDIELRGHIAPSVMNVSDPHLGVGHVKHDDVLASRRGASIWPGRAETWKRCQVFRCSDGDLWVFVTVHFTLLELGIEQDVVEIDDGSWAENDAALTDRHLEWARHLTERAQLPNARDPLPIRG